jgi:hypothetical protein
LFRIACLLFVIAFNSHLSISIALQCAFVISYTSMDSCISASTKFSSLVSFYTICASTKCCSIALSSSNSSMNTKFTNVAIAFVYFFRHQCILLLYKKLNYRCSSCIYIMIVCTNYIFS